EMLRIFIQAKKNPYEYALVRTFYFTAQRISSIIALDIKDVDLNAKTVTFLKMKRGETRPTPHTVPIDDETVTAIKQYLNGRTEGAVFLNKTLPTRLNDDQCRKHLKQLSIDADIPKEKKTIPHMYRRSNITHKKKRHCQDSDIMKITGQVDPQSLKHYDCCDVEDTRAVNEMYTPKFDEMPVPQSTSRETLEKELAEAKAEIQRMKKGNMPIEVYSK
ncbi:MAG: site-specific integrase, partial [Actinobacteria bacterium]|nr:site-specific integrase [Actinomycetota bacterium]